jgi:hypothetical protein
VSRSDLAQHPCEKGGSVDDARRFVQLRAAPSELRG